MTARTFELGELPDWPRCLSADEASRYLGVSRNVFDAEVKQNIWPKGIPRGFKGGKITWDRKALDNRVDLFSGAKGNATEEDGFERRRREAAARRERQVSNR